MSKCSKIFTHVCHNQTTFHRPKTIFVFSKNGSFQRISFQTISKEFCVLVNIVSVGNTPLDVASNLALLFSVKIFEKIDLHVKNARLALE